MVNKMRRSGRLNRNERHKRWLKNLQVSDVKFTSEVGLMPGDKWTNASTAIRPKKFLFFNAGTIHTLKGQNRVGSEVVISVHVDKKGNITKVREDVLKLAQHFD